jgi:hypothetical protein
MINTKHTHQMEHHDPGKPRKKRPRTQSEVDHARQQRLRRLDAEEADLSSSACSTKLSTDIIEVLTDTVKDVLLMNNTCEDISLFISLGYSEMPAVKARAIGIERQFTDLDNLVQTFTADLVSKKRGLQDELDNISKLVTEQDKWWETSDMFSPGTL